MAKYTQNVKKDQEAPFLELRGLAGLDLKSDFSLRTPNAWQLLENFDLYRNGSIRKVKPPLQYGSLQLTPPNVILNFIEYRQSDASDVQIVGVGRDGNLYDLTTGALITSLGFGPILNIPYMCVLSGTRIPYNFRYWSAGTVYNVQDAVIKYGSDGVLYIFVVGVAGTSGANEPPWPVSGAVVDGGVTWANVGTQQSGQFQWNYLVVFPIGQQPVKWDGFNVTQVGVALPGVPAMIHAITQFNTKTTDPNPNYPLVTGLQYAYTWFNPRTLAESSPSPLTGPLVSITEADAGYVVAQVNGSYLPAIATALATPTQVEEVQIGVPADQLAPPYGSGYTHLRFYRSRDGGAELFLLQTLYDNNGKPITDANGAVLPAQLVGDTDYRPLPITQSKAAIGYVKDGWVGVRNIAPDPVNLGIPPWTLLTLGNTQQTTILVLPAGGLLDPAQDIQPNAFAWTSSGTTPGFLAMVASLVITQPGNYTLQAFVDASALTGGMCGWGINTGANAVLLNLSQPAGTKGNVSGSVFLAAGTYVLVFYVSGPMASAGSQIIGSNPVVQAGTGISTAVGAAPLPDAALVVPAPGPTSNGPPPISAWAAVYQSSLYLLNYYNRQRVHYSGEYWEYFDVDGFLSFDSDTDDPILGLEGGYDRLIVGKESSVQNLFGTSPANFERTPLDPQHGIVGTRLMKAVGSTLFAWINQGLASFGLNTRPAVSATQQDQVLLGYSPESLIGEAIIPVTDFFDPLLDLATGCMTIDNKQNIFIVAAPFFCIPNTPYNNAILLGQLQQKVEWSIYSALPSLGLTTVREVRLPKSMGGQRAVLFAGCDGLIYQMFVNSVNNHGTVTATAVTQALPLPGTVSSEIWSTKKVFSELYVEGMNLQNFSVQYSVDGGVTWTLAQPLRNRNKIGMNGRQLVIQFVNAVGFTCNVEDMISYLCVNYKLQGVEQALELPVFPQIVLPPVGPPLD